MFHCGGVISDKGGVIRKDNFVSNDVVGCVFFDLFVNFLVCIEETYFHLAYEKKWCVCCVFVEAVLLLLTLTLNVACSHMCLMMLIRYCVGTLSLVSASSI